MPPMRRGSVPPVPERARVRALFAAVILLFLAQTWFIAAFEEPYPALTMPDFGSLGGHAHGAVSRTTRELAFGFADGSEREISWVDLLPLGVGRGDGLRRLCKSKPTSKPDRAPYSWFPSYRAALVRRARPEAREELRRWLEQRAHEIFPDADARWFECRVSSDVIRIRDGEVQRERRPHRKMRVELAP
jgi:hypothetical protein